MKKIPVRQNKFAIVDDEDYAILSKHQICINNGNDHLYIVLWSKNKNLTIPVTHLITKYNSQYVIVHKNKDFLDCRKENLLFIPYSSWVHGFSNNYVKSIKKTSIYRGVSFCDKSNSKKNWKGQLCYHNIRYAKRFNTEIEAARWYNEKAKELFGEFAYQNKI